MKKTFWNSVRTGLVLGLIGPLLGFCIYFWSQRIAGTVHHSFFGFIKFVSETNSVQAPVASLSLLFNLGLFFFLLWRKQDWTARGVLLATFCYAPLIIVLKFA